MERIGWLLLMLGTWGAAGFLMKIIGVRIDSYSAVLGIVIGYVIVGLALGFNGGGKLGVSWSYGAALIVGGCYIVGNWAFLKLARMEEVSVIVPLGGLNIIIPIVLGILLLGEAITLRKLAGIIFALLSILLLSGRE